MLARATIRAGDTTFVMPINPVSASWAYQENAISTDTIGGRVVQLLSVQVTDLTVESVAGSRSELQIAAEKIRKIMEYHVASLRPATFRVPSRAWDFQVYIKAMPQIGWDVAATSYPYQLQMAVDEDISGVKTKNLEEEALMRLYQGVGYNPAVHGGDPAAFDDIVETVLAASATSAGQVRAGGSVGVAGGSGRYQDPFRRTQYSASRIDAGVDYCGSGPVYAIGPGVLTNVGTPSQTGTFGSDMSVYRLTAGPAAGLSVYFAEHYHTAHGLRNGMSIDSNTVLYNMDGGCIEIGWSDGSGSYAWDRTSYSEGQLSALGKNFNELLVALGTRSGTSSGRPVVGPLPSEFPRQWKGKV